MIITGIIEYPNYPEVFASGHLSSQNLRPVQLELELIMLLSGETKALKRR